jgi:putative redox protein
MDAKVTLQHRMSFTATAGSGFRLNMGASPQVGGDDDGFQPMELVLIGLAGCTAMDVISILRKKRQHVTGFEVRARAGRAREHPKVFSDVTITYIVEGINVDPEAVRRAIELSETRYCPVQAMLAPTVPIKHEYEIVEVAAGEAI